MRIRDRSTDIRVSPRRAHALRRLASAQFHVQRACPNQGSSEGLFVGALCGPLGLDPDLETLHQQVHLPFQAGHALGECVDPFGE